MLEKFLLKNMTQILFTLCGMIFLTWLFQYLDFSSFKTIKIPFLKEYKFEGVISTFQMFTTIGAIFAFWYGYKKYERDKELEILDKYGKKYDEIKKFHNENEVNEKSLDIYINKLFNLWREEYYLYKKNYINKNLWKIWEKHIVRELNKLITDTSTKKIDIKIIIKQIVNNEIIIQNQEFNSYINSKYKEIYIENIKIITYILQKFNFKNNNELKESLDSETRLYFNEIISDLNLKKKIFLKNLSNLPDENLKTILLVKLGENTFLKKSLINP